MRQGTWASCSGFDDFAALTTAAAWFA